MPLAKRKPKNGLSISRTDGCQSMMKSVLDDLQLEPRPKMWQKFDIEEIAHKKFVPPGQMVNGKFYCDVLRQLRENIWRKHPDQQCNNSWILHHNNALVHESLIVWQFLASTKTTVIPHPPYSPDLTTCEFFLFLQLKLKLKGAMFWQHWTDLIELQDVMKTLMQNDFQQWFQSWKFHWDQCRRGLLQRGWRKIEILVGG